jgi:hypothetical protein
MTLAQKIEDILNGLPAGKEMTVFEDWLEPGTWVIDNDGEYYPS